MSPRCLLLLVLLSMVALSLASPRRYPERRDRCRGRCHDRNRHDHGRRRYRREVSPNDRYDAGRQIENDDRYQAGKAAYEAAQEAARDGYSVSLNSGAVRVWESRDGNFQAGVGVSSDGSDHGVGFGLTGRW